MTQLHADTLANISASHVLPDWLFAGLFIIFHFYNLLKVSVTLQNGKLLTQQRLCLWMRMQMRQENILFPLKTAAP